MNPYGKTRGASKMYWVVGAIVIAALVIWFGLLRERPATQPPASQTTGETTPTPTEPTPPATTTPTVPVTPTQPEPTAPTQP